MQSRVACRRCGAHRDLTLTAVCLVCRSVAWDPIPLSIRDCYVTLQGAAAALLKLTATPPVLAIVDAIALGSASADDESERARVRRC
jgi:hypothetical protein